MTAGDVFPVDEYKRRIRDDRTVPPLDGAREFDRWRGGLLKPSVVLTYWRHNGTTMRPCTGGWLRSGDWWFVCGQCHPDAVDEATGRTANMRGANPVRVDSIEAMRARAGRCGCRRCLAPVKYRDRGDFAPCPRGES